MPEKIPPFIENGGHARPPSILLRDNLARSDQLVMNCRRDRFKLFSLVITALATACKPKGESRNAIPR